MGLLSMFAKAGIAKRVFDEARKPENQQKAKDMVAKMRGKDDEGSEGGQGGQAGQGGQTSG